MVRLQVRWRGPSSPKALAGETPAQGRGRWIGSGPHARRALFRTQIGHTPISHFERVWFSRTVMRELAADPIVTRAQLPLIAKIIDDETWLEGERRGAPVLRHDPVVLERVCAIVLEIGGSLRERAAVAQRAG